MMKRVGWREGMREREAGDDTMAESIEFGGNFSSETIKNMYVTFKWVLMFSWAILVIRKLVKTFQGTVWEMAL